ncbi:bifunctional diaminohydroxyphosphoribosylaminopyrimidine deaminase/5-amino-6-(5-phosphoribosylamino)uracil reductase RibD [Candidatus Palauibacter sp.]|uniref:bifunctional diaminohydroxyphosphoribosylaminopyrimidine deaminase/5-amino-6-(5-phosphoribosylamino)uracil reductase RibD n=1 Tax=Candidatus Palauibacter sp. TaxID=3101350 RepID=UPI003B029ED3
MTVRGFDPIAGAPPSRTEDVRHIREALALARRGLGRVSPNPLVGAVVARGKQVLGTGWHSEYGGDHAEVVALREAGARAAGATLYVSLEPCRHTGQTPPCTAAIIRSGIRRVVIACRDPNPEARHGAEVLRQAGLDVEIGIEGTAAKRLNAPFLWFHQEWVPFASLKLALSLDAKLGAERVRTPVTGIRALDEVHRLRACHDAILIGRRTVAVDDPLLTARGEEQPRVPPVRAVLDTTLKLDTRSQLVRTVEQAPVWVFADAAAEGFEERAAPLRDAGAEVIGVPRRDEHSLSVSAVWNELAMRGVLSVLIEGGGQVAAATLRRGHVQRIHAFLAPVFFGDGGVPAFPGLGPSSPGDWRPVQRESLGQDTRIVFEHRRLDEVLRRL